jgi:hypothetical protein
MSRKIRLVVVPVVSVMLFLGIALSSTSCSHLSGGGSSEGGGGNPMAIAGKVMMYACPMHWPLMLLHKARSGGGEDHSMHETQGAPTAPTAGAPTASAAGSGL